MFTQSGPWWVGAVPKYGHHRREIYGGEPATTNNGWQTKEKKPVKKADLWKRLDSASRGHQVQWFWLKGHAGHPENERADELACLGAEEAAAQAVDNEWGPAAGDIHRSLLSQATDEPGE